MMFAGVYVCFSIGFGNGYHALSGLGFSFVFQAEDGIRELGRSRGHGDVYKRQGGEG